MKKRGTQPLRIGEVFSYEDRKLWRDEDRESYTAAREERRLAWEAWHYNYTASDFKRKRTWVILAKNKKTQLYTGKVSGARIEWLLVQAFIYYVNMNQTEPFALSKYRIKERVLVNSLQIVCKKAQADLGDDYDVFIARLGSKNCPIKADWDTYYKERHLGSYHRYHIRFREK